MSNDIKAVIYFYNKCRHDIGTGKIKGLKLKSLTTFVRQIQDLGFAISKNQVPDYDVYGYEVNNNVCS